METTHTTSDHKLKLGLLDLGVFLSYRQTSTERIIETIETVKKAEKLGFSRYWIAEHHSKEAAWRGTDIVLTLIANHTSKIRVGSAGIQLNYYNPFLISENYKLLANLFNQRIDLGLVQGRADIKQIDEILMADKAETSMNFLEKVEFLKSVYFEPTTPTLISPPYDGFPPDLWIMGTSLRNLDFAIDKKLNYCLSICHKKIEPLQINIITEKINAVRVEKNVDELPEISIMVSVICGKTQKQASKMVERGLPIMDLSYSGDQNGCYDFLTKIKESFGVSEIIIADLCGTQKDRISSLSLLSEIMA